MIYRIIVEVAALFVGLMVCLTLAGDLVSASSNLSVYGGILLFILTLCGAFWVGRIIYFQIRKGYFDESTH
jgi:hypothetical protein